MQSGRLRQLVILQQRTISQGSNGEALESWSNVATLPANVGMPGGTERFVPEVDRVVATVTHRVRLRYRDGIGPINRLLWGSRVLEILSAADPDGRRREMVCMCRELA